jgi:hypothetical protein
MRASSSVLSVLTSLRVGERVLVRSDDGLLGAEYALFEGTEIVLRATDPVSVREVGYMTTAKEALARLSRADVTPALAEEAARSFRPEIAAAFARGTSARGLVPQLGPYELFEGASFSATSNRYEGAWLDLGAVATALAELDLPSAAASMQALHLAVALAEVAPSAPVHMSTAAATRDRRPGERTHTKVQLERVLDLPAALRALRPPRQAIQVEAAHERRIRQTLLSRVRERLAADSSPGLRAHIAELEGALGNQTMQLGPLADPALQSIERQLAGGDARGVQQQLDELERSQGKGPGTRYLRARAALLQGDQAPRSVAQVLSELAHEDKGFHEATLVAARTWLAAGEDANARFYARKLAEDQMAPESERLVAMEILDETAVTARSHMPPPVGPDSSPHVAAAKRAPLFPSVGDVPPPAALPNLPSLPPATGWTMPANQNVGQGFDPGPRPGNAPGGPSAGPWWPGAGPGVDSPSRMRAGPVVRYEPELVESLSLPAGATEATLGTNDLPRTPVEARVTMTRLSRDLARDYRLWYGKSLRCNVLAVDAMQQHLAHRFAGAPISDAGVAWELRRHGALVSEIFARGLGGVWVDIGPSEPGYWAMLLPAGLRVLPIGRVYRFVALGNREKDLVSYYLDLEARVRAIES